MPAIVLSAYVIAVGILLILIELGVCSCSVYNTSIYLPSQEQSQLTPTEIEWLDDAREDLREMQKLEFEGTKQFRKDLQASLEHNRKEFEKLYGFDIRKACKEAAERADEAFGESIWMYKARLNLIEMQLLEYEGEND